MNLTETTIVDTSYINYYKNDNKRYLLRKLLTETAKNDISFKKRTDKPNKNRFGFVIFSRHVTSNHELAIIVFFPVEQALLPQQLQTHHYYRQPGLNVDMKVSSESVKLQVLDQY